MSEKQSVKMNVEDLQFFESLLITRRREIVAAQNNDKGSGIFQNQGEQSVESSSFSNHLADVASDLTSLETNFDLAAREGKYLVYVEEALQRIKNGSFGVCKVCNSLIPKARLEAVPTATKCVNCKEETKKKEKEDNRIEMARAFAEQQRRNR